MKIFYFIPKEMKRPGDIYIFGLSRIGLLVFLFISCITVYGGLKSQISPYMAAWSPFWASCALGLVFLTFAFGPDYINSRVTRYVTRTILQGEFKDAQSGVILFICVSLVSFLTVYSYNMSQVSAYSMTETVVGFAKEKDTTPLDETYRADQAAIATGRESEAKKVTEKYDRLIEAETAPYKTKIEREETRIALLEKSSAKDKAARIRGAKSNIAYYQSLVAKVETKYADPRQAELEQIEKRFNQKDSLLTVIYLSNRDTTLTRNTATVVVHTGLKEYLKAQIGGIAGKAVFFYLLMAIMLEILYFRNDMHPNPIFSPFEFKPSALLEVLALPFVAAGRHTINWARKKYNNLPDVVDRKDWKEIIDQGEIQRVHSKPATPPAPPYKPEQLNGHGSKKKSGLKPGKPLETTKFQTETREFETLKGTLAQISNFQREIHTRIWKMNQSVGLESTNKKRMFEACTRINETIDRYIAQIQHDGNLVSQFESALHDKGTYAALDKARSYLETPTEA